MIKKIIGFLLVLFVFNGLFAKNATLFSYDHAKLKKSFVTINIVNRYLESHPMDYQNLLSDNEALKMLALEARMPLPAFTDTLKSWPFLANFAFTFGGMMFIGILGIGCGVVGVLVVYIITQDRQQTLNSLYGCIGGTILGAGCIFLLYGALYSSAYSGL